MRCYLHSRHPRNIIYTCVVWCGVVWCGNDVAMLGINILGVVENMSSLSIPMSELKNTHSSIRLVNSRGENMTDSVLFL